jgi:hypothetical protein
MVGKDLEASRAAGMSTCEARLCGFPGIGHFGCEKLSKGG